MNRLFPFLFFATLMVNTACMDLKTKVDIIIYNTKVYTVDSNWNTVECIAIDDSNIVAVGSDAEIRSKYAASRYINAKGLYVYPGFIDAHSHFTGYAAYLNYADLSEARSFKEVLDIIAAYHELHPERWIIGRGWDQNKWPGKNYPDNRQLNQLYPETPVVLTRIDGHAVLANNTAIFKAGLHAPYPAGEALMSNNQPSGIFLEHLADQIRLAIPEPGIQQWTELLAEATLRCHEAGLTSVTDAGIDKTMILMLDSLQKKGSVNIRIDAMVNPSQDNLDYFMHNDYYRTPFLRVGSVKLYADGALGSRGACLLQPYTDDPSNYGIIVTTAGEMKKVCEQALKQNFQVCTHAIGDSAVRLVLKTYAAVLQNKNDLRWRIEHAQVVDPDDLALFGKYSIIPSVQSTHATSDMGWAKSRLGPERVKSAYAYKQLLEQNGWLPNGTDFPVENISPLMTFYAAVARKDINGNPPGGFQPENAVSRTEALKSITTWAAKAAFEENYKGSIETGKYADIVILDKDILSAPEQELPLTKVMFTIQNGKIVYEATPKSR